MCESGEAQKVRMTMVHAVNIQHGISNDAK